MKARKSYYLFVVLLRMYLDWKRMSRGIQSFPIFYFMFKFFFDVNLIKFLSQLRSLKRLILPILTKQKIIIQFSKIKRGAEIQRKRVQQTIIFKEWSHLIL